jgi:hypothetical protein
LDHGNPWAIPRLSLKGSEIAENNISSANAQTTEKLLLMFRFQHGFVEEAFTSFPVPVVSLDQVS